MYRLFHPGFDLDLDSDDPQISNPSFPLIRDSDFTVLMDICFSKATCLSMTRANWDRTINKGLEKELQPFLINSIKTCKWFCYGTREDSPLEVLVYQANAKTKSLILKYFRELFLERVVNGEWVPSDQTLEDLCFFSHDELFFGTVTHEAICHVYPPDGQVEAIMLSNSYWILEKDDTEQQIKLSQCLN